MANSTPNQISEVVIEIGDNPKMDLGSILPDSHFSIEQPMKLAKENRSILSWANQNGKVESAVLNIKRTELRDTREMQIMIEANGKASKKWRFP